MIYLRLFFEFFKTGLFAIGGGLATLPFLSDMADRTGWFTHGDLADLIAISESTPGPIGVNMATYAGFNTAGIPGAVIATLGLICPSIIIIIAIAKILDKFQKNPLVNQTFYGLRPASVALISAAGILVVKMALLDMDAFHASGKLTDLIRYKEVILAVALFFLMKKFHKLHPAVFLAGSLAVGILLRLGGA